MATNAQALDLLKATLESLPSDGEWELEQEYHDYLFCRWIQDKKELDGGKEISRRVALDKTGNAKFHRMYDTFDPAVKNILSNITVPWCQVSTNYSWDAFEIKQNMGSRNQILNLAELRRKDGLIDLADILEERTLKTPTDSSSEPLYPYGIKYYLNQNTSGSAEGFIGQTIEYQDGSTGTTCAGIDAATETKWRNYVMVHDGISTIADVLTDLRQAFIATKFRLPTFVADPAKPRPIDRYLLCNLSTMVAIQNQGDTRDDNTRPKDLAGSIRVDEQGTYWFNSVPFVYADDLDDDTNDPIYGVHLGKLRPVVFDGHWFVREPAMNDRNQPTVYSEYIFGAYNILCTSRRKAGFVVHKQRT